MLHIADEVRGAVDRVDDVGQTVEGVVVGLLLLADEVGGGEKVEQALLQKLLHLDVIGGDEVAVALLGGDGGFDVVGVEDDLSGRTDGLSDGIAHGKTLLI